MSGYGVFHHIDYIQTDNVMNLSLYAFLNTFLPTTQKKKKKKNIEKVLRKNTHVTHTFKPSLKCAFFFLCSDGATIRGRTDSCHSSICLTVSVHIDWGGCRLANTHTHTHTHTHTPVDHFKTRGRMSFKLIRRLKQWQVKE